MQLRVGCVKHRRLVNYNFARSTCQRPQKLAGEQRLMARGMFVDKTDASLSLSTLAHKKDLKNKGI